MLTKLPPRIIPTLLLKNKSFVKGSKFKNHQYIGDPLNIIKLFNDLQASEILIMGINARENNGPDYDYLDKISSQAFMPLSYGGNINNSEQASEIISRGFEKVVLNTISFLDPEIISSISEDLGASSTVGCIDVKKNFIFDGYKVFSNCGKKKEKISPQDLAVMYQEYGAGELIINNIDLEGTRKGFDISLMKKLNEKLSIPLVALGGASNIKDIEDLILATPINGIACGTLFVYGNESQDVLLNYVNITDVFSENQSIQEMNHVTALKKNTGLYISSIAQ